MVNILIGCTGSVATIKLPLLLEILFEYSRCHNVNVNIRVIATERARHFFSVKDLPPESQVFYDHDEWDTWSNRGDPVLHIELGKWADLLVIAPLDANTLAKIANGICDNLLTCTVRAWDVTKPLLFCPAMNTRMYEHPLTQQQISLLQSWNYTLVPVIEKVLMCGDTGAGAMADVSTILDYIQKYF